MQNEKSKFIPPTFKEFREYCISLEPNNIDEEDIKNIFDHLSSGDWKIGGKPMISWKAKVNDYYHHYPDKNPEKNKATITKNDWETISNKFNKKFDYGSMSIHREDVLNFIYNEIFHTENK